MIEKSDDRKICRYRNFISIKQKENGKKTPANFAATFQFNSEKFSSKSVKCIKDILFEGLNKKNGRL